MNQINNNAISVVGSTPSTEGSSGLGIRAAEGKQALTDVVSSLQPQQQSFGLAQATSAVTNIG